MAPAAESLVPVTKRSPVAEIVRSPASLETTPFTVIELSGVIVFSCLSPLSSVEITFTLPPMPRYFDVMVIEGLLVFVAD